MPSAYYTKISDAELSSFKGALGRDMRYISEHGINSLNEEELKKVGRNLIREANKRVRALEQSGYTDMPSYRHFKNDVGKWTVQKKNLNQIRHIVMQAYSFLLAKTSTTEGAKQFLDTTTDKWIGRNTTREQREKIWDTFNRLEKSHPGIFTVEAYTSSELMQDIYTISTVLDATDWDVDKALAMLDNEHALEFEDIEPGTEDENTMQEAADELAGFYFRRYS